MAHDDDDHDDGNGLLAGDIREAALRHRQRNELPPESPKLLGGGGTLEESQTLLYQHLESGAQTERPQPVPVHPRRTTILIAFSVTLSALVFLMLGLGFGLHKPMLGFLFLAALIPSLLILALTLKRTGRPDNEAPLEIVLIGFATGVLVTVPVALLGYLLGRLVEGMTFGTLSFTELFFLVMFETVILTSFIEESAKYLLALFSTGETILQYIPHPHGMCVYGLAVALGFAALENVSYILEEHSSGGDSWTLALLRGVLSVPLHATTGVLIGTALARREFLGEAQPWYSTLALPVLVHGVYDLVWLLPVRHGAFNEAERTHQLQTTHNTRDIGSGLDVLQALNVGMVCIMAWWAWRGMRNTNAEYDELAGPANGAEGQGEVDAPVHVEGAV